MSSKPGIQSHRDLLVWQKGMDLAEACYTFTANFPKEETYGLVSQIRRSAVSVPSNVAEGFGRENTGSFIQHLRIAQGSLKELETQLMISSRVGHCTEKASGALLSLRCFAR
jgi:four helix bundle protein